MVTICHYRLENAAQVVFLDAQRTANHLQAYHRIVRSRHLATVYKGRPSGWFSVSRPSKTCRWRAELTYWLDQTWPKLIASLPLPLSQGDTYQSIPVLGFVQLVANQGTASQSCWGHVVPQKHRANYSRMCCAHNVLISDAKLQVITASALAEFIMAFVNWRAVEHSRLWLSVKQCKVFLSREVGSHSES